MSSDPTGTGIGPAWTSPDIEATCTEPATLADNIAGVRLWTLVSRRHQARVTIVTDATDATRVARRRVIAIAVEPLPVVAGDGTPVVTFGERSLTGALLREDPAGMGPASGASAAYVWVLTRLDCSEVAAR